MEQIRINTTQNVALSYEPAGIGFRILAGILDQIFFYVYVFLVIFIFQKFVISHNYYSEEYEKAETYNSIMYAIMVIFLLPAMLYHLLSETFMNGQSFGKKIAGIKVVKLDGTQPNFGSYLIRSMLRLIDVSVFSPVVAIISIAASEKSQRLGDMAAGTTVIKMNTKVSLNDTILYNRKDDYKIVYEQVMLLSDKEANLIKEVLEFSIKNNQPQHMKQLALKLKNKLGIENGTEKDADFLNTILRDYSHYRFEN